MYFSNSRILLWTQESLVSWGYTPLSCVDCLRPRPYRCGPNDSAVVMQARTISFSDVTVCTVGSGDAHHVSAWMRAVVIVHGLNQISRIAYVYAYDRHVGAQSAFNVSLHRVWWKMPRRTTLRFPSVRSHHWTRWRSQRSPPQWNWRTASWQSRMPLINRSGL